MNNKPVGGRSPETSSYHTDINSNNNNKKENARLYGGGGYQHDEQETSNRTHKARFMLYGFTILEFLS
jgi:hypothetical protein